MPEGHRFENISANESARQHVGDSWYATTNIHYAPEPGRQNKRLLEAAQDGQLDRLSQLVEKHSVAADYEDDDGLTALHCAAWGGHLYCIEYLIQNDAYVNARSDKYGTPLCLAAVRRHSNAVAYLLEQHGADANAFGGLLGSALHAACYDVSFPTALKHEDANATVENLLRLGADPNCTREIDFEFAKQLGLGRFPCKSYAPRYPPIRGTVGSALHLAVRCHAPSLAVILLNNKADPNTQEQYRRRLTGSVEGVTPLMRACRDDRNCDLVQNLLRNGASLELQDSDGFSALMWAACRDAYRCLSELLSRGAPVDLRCKLGKTALIYAAEHGHAECLTLLLGHAMSNQSLVHGQDLVAALDLARKNNHQSCENVLVYYNSFWHFL